jgi:hypothetical protein
MVGWLIELVSGDCCLIYELGDQAISTDHPTDQSLNT